MRFSVRRATFAQVRKSALYEKAHSGTTPSRKSAFCTLDLTEKRTLARSPRARLTEKRILPANLTEKRILQPAGLTENRILAVLKTPECAFP